VILTAFRKCWLDSKDHTNVDKQNTIDEVYKKLLPELEKGSEKNNLKNNVKNFVNSIIDMITDYEKLRKFTIHFIDSTNNSAKEQPSAKNITHHKPKQVNIEMNIPKQNAQNITLPSSSKYNLSIKQPSQPVILEQPEGPQVPKALIELAEKQLHIISSWLQEHKQSSINMKEVISEINEIYINGKPSKEAFIKSLKNSIKDREFKGDVDTLFGDLDQLLTYGEKGEAVICKFISSFEKEQTQLAQQANHSVQQQETLWRMTLNDVFGPKFGNRFAKDTKSQYSLSAIKKLLEFCDLDFARHNVSASAKLKELADSPACETILNYFLLQNLDLNNIVLNEVVDPGNYGYVIQAIKDDLLKHTYIGLLQDYLKAVVDNEVNVYFAKQLSRKRYNPDKNDETVSHKDFLDSFIKLCFHLTGLKLLNDSEGKVELERFTKNTHYFGHKSPFTEGKQFGGSNSFGSAAVSKLVTICNPIMHN
jgi:hypothetical protein